MSRTLPRAAGVIPGKLVSLTTLITGADDTECFSRRMKRILAQRIGNAKSLRGGFRCKTFCGIARRSEQSVIVLVTTDHCSLAVDGDERLLAFLEMPRLLVAHNPPGSNIPSLG